MHSRLGRTDGEKPADLFNVPHKSQGHVVQIYILIRGFAHGDAAAPDCPDGMVFQYSLLDFEYVIPAAAFHILFFPDKPDQFQPAEYIGGEGILNAGFKEGDKIVSVEGKSVTTGNDLISEIQSHKAGDIITVTVDREGQNIEIKTELE